MPNDVIAKISVSAEYVTFYNQVKEYLSEDYEIPEDRMTGEDLDIPNIRDIPADRKTHRNIVNNILAYNKSLVSSNFIAFWHGFIGQTNDTFKKINQQLNLAMNCIYSLNAKKDMTSAELDAINELLYEHLDRMMRLPVLKNWQRIEIGIICTDITKSLKLIKGGLALKGEILEVSFSDEYSRLLNTEALQMRAEITRLETRLETRIEEMRSDHMARLEVLAAALGRAQQNHSSHPQAVPSATAPQPK